MRTMDRVTTKLIAAGRWSKKARQWSVVVAFRPVPATEGAARRRRRRRQPPRPPAQRQ